MFKLTRNSFAQTLLAVTFTVLPVSNASAGPGTLPAAPLFLSSIVEPNVYFTLDDSGSMEWGPMVEDGTAGLASNVWGGVPIIDGQHRGYYSPTFTTLFDASFWDFATLPPTDGRFLSDGTIDPEWARAWVVRNHIGNNNYYNPDVIYEPWAGTNADGSPMYLDADPTEVLKHPNFPRSGGGEWMDLTINYTFREGGTESTTMWIPTYFIWPDTEGDGVIDQGDDKTEVRIAAGTAEMLNFANWFQYHRSRINATKAIIGRTINNTDASRMGMSLFNLNTQVDSISMSDPAQKRQLLQALYGIVIPLRRTPARQALYDTATYFKDATGSGPILSAADGGECQQNFSILMSDGFWNESFSGVDNADADGGIGTNNTIFDGNAAQSNDGGNYADAYSNTLADIAMHMYEEDLRPDLANLVPTQAGVDENDKQHLVSYTIAFGLKGQLDPGVDNPLAAGFTWPLPVGDTETTVDDMWHAAYNGRGKFLSAQDPTSLQASLSAAITDISERTGTAAAVAINSAQLSLESVVYLAQFNSNRWQGNLLAFPIIDTDTGELAASPKWDASANLTGRDFSASPRTVITYSDDAGVNDGVAFQWGSISTNMQNDLKTNAVGGSDSDAIGTARLEYLRGDRSNEGTGLFFRERISMLGDLVNSGPVFVGEPSLSWPDFDPFPEGTEAYSEFKNGSASTRTKMVYAGANDGMLHGFDDSDGREVFAYYPGIFNSTGIGDGLHYLTEPNYVHKFYVDLTPTLSDVYISSGASTEWHTILVGGLRSGGRGIYALNVTNPSAFSEANAADMVLWEFTSNDDIDLGYTYSRPAIALTNAGTWVAIFGNGYNDLGSGVGSLFIVDIEKGTNGWQTGDYQKISTGVGSTGNRNGLTTPALADIDGNGTVDRVYAGDLEGNMWVFDMESTNENTWDVAYKSGSTPKPLFTTPANQPLTAKPVLAKHPTQPDSSSPSNAPNIMVYFGSGQYLTDADKTSTNVQSFYGVWDTGDDELVQSDLIEQTFDPSFTVKVLTRNAIDYSTDHGWYFDLPESGERAVTSPIARADTVFFNSFVPVDDPCTVGGFGFKFAVDMTTGGSPLAPTFDANGDGVIDEYDMVSNGSDESTLVAVRQEGYLPEPVFIEDLAFTAETATKVKALKNIPVGRFSWQELIQ